MENNHLLLMVVVDLKVVAVWNVSRIKFKYINDIVKFKYINDTVKFIDVESWLTSTRGTSEKICCTETHIKVSHIVLYEQIPFEYFHSINKI